MKQNFLASVLILPALLACTLVTASPTARPVPTDEPAPTASPALPTGEATREMQPTATATETPVPQLVFGEIAREHVEALTAIGARTPGSSEERLAEQYITETFTQLGYSPQSQAFTAEDEYGSSFTSANVVALKQGLSAKEIIVGAHYDSGAEGLGVDDNASGVAVLLESAAHLAKIETPYTIRFIAFGSEENDLDGSYAYTDQMSQQDVENTLAMINLDSLAAGDVTYVYSEEGSHAFLRDWTLDWANANGLPLQTIRNVELTDEGAFVADYGAFSELEIPYLYFEATNWDLGDQDGYTQVDPQYGEAGYIWHTPYDTLEYLEATFPGRLDSHLEIFCSTLYAILTEFKLS